MASVHEFKCDHCGKRVKASYNGEHWLAPAGWLQCWDDQQAKLIDEHICPQCRPRPRKKPKNDASL